MKRLVVCSDGTWNTPDQEDRGTLSPTNVVRTARAVAPTAPDGTCQVVFYDQGVGTARGLERITGGAFGKGLYRNVQDAYRFLVNNYDEGDEIWLFGFSRGAYTARSCAGLIRNAGLLRKIHAHKFPEAEALYRHRDKAPDSEAARAFRAEYSHQPRVHFIGVWDTVGALGIPIAGLHWFRRKKFNFHDVQLSSTVHNAFHALAIDERRTPFRPAIWETRPGADQRVEQTWFAGVHSNVGGGYQDHDLADLAFLWMVERAEECGLVFSEDLLAPVRLGREEKHRGVLRDSMKLVYRLSGEYPRPIGVVPEGNETVDDSARLRHRDDPDYRPANLVDWLGRRPGEGRDA